MVIQFVASEVFNDCYHAMSGDAPVGMVIKDSDGRWNATAYRTIAPDDLQASFTDRANAEEFIRANVLVSVEG